MVSWTWSMPPTSYSALLRRSLMIESPVLPSSLYCSAVILARRLLWISFFASSSTSLPSGAFVTKSISVVSMSSLMMRSPPRSPSTKTVTIFSRQRSLTLSGMLVPFMLMTFLKPCLSRFRTSARPSTRMISSDSSTPGPAGRRSLPHSWISMTRTLIATSSASSCESGMTSSMRVLSSSLARSMTYWRLLILMSSMLSVWIFALQGPMRWIISSAAATIAVSALSSDDGMIISPDDLPCFAATLTSMRPMRPERCSSRSSRSLPRSPSVCPKIAPMTSGLSTSPSMLIEAWMMYFADICAIFAICFPSCLSQGEKPVLYVLEYDEFSVIVMSGMWLPPVCPMG